MRSKLSTKMVFTSVVALLVLSGCNSNEQLTQDSIELSSKNSSDGKNQFKNSINGDLSREVDTYLRSTSLMPFMMKQSMQNHSSINSMLEDRNLIPYGSKNIALLIKDDKVNEVSIPKLEVSNTKYRYRIHNNSNDKNYNLMLSDKSSFIMVATKDGFLDEPKELNHVALKSGDYIEIIIDFARYSVGDRVMLVSSSSSMMDTYKARGMMGGMNQNQNMSDDQSMMNDNSNTNSDQNMMNDTSNMNNDQSMHDNSNMNDNQNTMLTITNTTLMRFDIIINEDDHVRLYTNLNQIR